MTAPDRPIVGDLAEQKRRYRRWYESRSQYFWPSLDELEVMMSRLEEGDELIPLYAMTILVKRPNGETFTVDRKGRIEFRA